MRRDTLRSPWNKKPVPPKSVLERLYSKEKRSSSWMAQKFGVSPTTVIGWLKARGISVRSRPKGKEWTDRERRIIKQFYPTESWEKLFLLLPNRSKQAITIEAYKLKVKRECRYDSLKGDKNPAKRPEVRRKISLRKKGVRFSEEHIRKIVEANKRIWALDPTKHPRYGKRLSLETRRKISESKKKNPVKPPWTGKKRPKEVGRKISEIQKGRKLSDETKRNIAKALKRLWQNLEYRNKVVGRAVRAVHKRPTKPEGRLIHILKEHNFPFRYVGDGSFVVNGLNPDFIATDGKRKVIELFGDYWHTERADSIVDREGGRINFYKNLGYDALIIWEHELSNESTVVQRIRTFCSD